MGRYTMIIDRKIQYCNDVSSIHLQFQCNPDINFREFFEGEGVE